MAELSAEDQAVSAFMADMEPPQQQEVAQANPEGEAQVAAEDAQQVQEEPAAEQQSEAQDVQTIEIDPDEPLFEQELEIDGKKTTQKLALKELQNGYLRQQDYTRKTQDLARQREELPKIVAKHAQELSTSYEKRLAELSGLVTKTVAAELADKDINKLATEDPFEYVRVSNRARQLNELLQAVQKEQEAEAAKRKEQEQQATQQRWQQSLEILNRDIPDFGPAVVKRLIDASEEWGFTREEVSSWTDHRLVKMLHALTDKKAVEAKKPVVEKKVAVVTKVMKPGQTTKPRTAIDEDIAKLRKTGKAEDALSYFESIV